MQKLWRRACAEVQSWPAWWATRSPRQRWLPLILIVAYLTPLFFLRGQSGGLRGDHLAVSALLLILAYGGPLLCDILPFVLPVALTGFVYDSQHFYADLIRGPVHVEEPYRFDKFFFGIETAHGRLTPNEWWQLHLHPVLDLFTGFLYLTFVAIFVAICAYFYFYLSKVGTKLRSAAYIYARRGRIMWTFFWLNLLGYSTYYWYAAAPPWYVSQYGLGPARMDTPASSAGCVRFDALLGTSFFSEMYGRAADVFGAIPSLHVAYPLLAIYYAFQFGSLRIFSILFYVSMCFSAVYLNHHYMLDILWGSAYTLICAVGMDLWYARRSSQSELQELPEAATKTA